jgi:hypothetical protein
MGTKNNPGQFDCHAKAEPDEPLFTLLARDPLASHLVAIWGYIRMGDVGTARTRFDIMNAAVVDQYRKEPETVKPIEALQLAGAMADWRKAHRK